jgi:hypothetical protein
MALDSIRDMLRNGQLQAGRVEIAGRRVRTEDGWGSHFTEQPMDQRKAERRKANKQARKARRKNK